MKKKALTLTELLVVVVIIGVLSAVVLPKFSKVLETGKTGEAEEILSAVRNEQEARCALDKNYTNMGNKLASLSKNANVQAGSVFNSEYYAYRLENGGMKAERKGSDYTLKIPSYADGRICCEGTGCSKLNKDYPACGTLIAGADYVQVNANCAAGEVAEGEIPVPVYECTEGAKRNVSGLCGTETGEECIGNAWQPYTHSVPLTQDEKQSCRCDTAQDLEQPCTNGAEGKETRTKTCNSSTGRYEYSAWNTSGCSTDDEFTTCDAANDRWWDEELGGQESLELVDACFNREMIYNGSKTIAGKLEELTPSQMLAACCECCPEGTSALADFGTCGSCQELGKNYFFDSNHGTCGGCEPRFKPMDTNIMVSVNGFLADYEAQRFSQCPMAPQYYTGRSLRYSKRPCSTCDNMADSCDEMGYGDEANRVLDQIATEYPSTVKASSNSYPRVVASFPQGYKAATFTVAPGAPGAASSGASSLGFMPCANYLEPPAVGGNVALSFVAQPPAQPTGFAGFYVPVYRRSTGYKCVR